MHVPSVEAEDKRHLHRELSTLTKDQTRRTNRTKGLLVGADFLDKLDELRLWDGAPLPAGLRARLEREYAGWQFIGQEINALKAEKAELIRSSSDPDVEKVRQLLKLKGSGPVSAWLFVFEFFAWRDFNRRQIGGLVGLAPTPYQSSEESREQGISKAGNRPVRGIVIDIAWGWLRHQPDSELSVWFRGRFDHSKRMRTIGIVALARKLLIALWRYLEFGETPAGAQLKA